MDKVIVVTGASRGIGRRIAYDLASKGNKVIANYNKSEEAALSLKDELLKNNIEIDLYKADVSNKEEVDGLIDFAYNKYGRIDVLVNNAGISQEKLFTDITSEEFDKMMKVNLYSVFYATQAAVKYMLRVHEGCIINISSIYGLTGGSCEVHYSMAKAGIDGMTKALAKELGPSNIRVNSVAPGAIDTDMNKYVTEDEWKELEEETPLNRRGRPIDISRCVNWLVEDEFTTGQVISPNGGLVIY